MQKEICSERKSPFTIAELFFYLIIHRHVSAYGFDLYQMSRYIRTIHAMGIVPVGGDIQIAIKESLNYSAGSFRVKFKCIFFREMNNRISAAAVDIQVSHYMEIFLPSSYHGELLLETASGEIYSDIDIVSEQDVSISSISGDISFPSVTAKNADVTSTSGNVQLYSLLK